jgi:hypothetical protein
MDSTYQSRFLEQLSRYKALVAAEVAGPSQPERRAQFQALREQLRNGFPALMADTERKIERARENLRKAPHPPGEGTPAATAEAVNPAPETKVGIADPLIDPKLGDKLRLQLLEHLSPHSVV